MTTGVNHTDRNIPESCREMFWTFTERKQEHGTGIKHREREREGFLKQEHRQTSYGSFQMEQAFQLASLRQSLIVSVCGDILTSHADRWTQEKRARGSKFKYAAGSDTSCQSSMHRGRRETSHPLTRAVRRRP